MTMTYAEMNAKIVDLLRWDKDNPVLLYAAQRIEELEAEAGRLQRELHDEQIRRSEWEKMYNQAIAEPAPNALCCGHPRREEETK